jgi:hypothetical protein
MALHVAPYLALQYLSATVGYVLAATFACSQWYENMMVSVLQKLSRAMKKMAKRLFGKKNKKVSLTNWPCQAWQAVTTRCCCCMLSVLNVPACGCGTL